ncbi:MAG: DUF4434 domain-containing protein [Clostridia bacterium]|nr:DUF4434 domain-containing protein [Clostridia bacterium]
MRKSLSLILAVAMIMSCFAGISINVSAKEESQRLNLNTEYAYSYPVSGLAGDNEGKNLTDGNLSTAGVYTVINEPRTSLGKTFYLFTDGKEPHYYVQNEFGLISSVEQVELTFDTANGAVLPNKVEVFASNDGYNYNLYPQQTVSTSTKDGKTIYTVTFAEEVKAMGVKVFIYSSLDKKSALYELSVIGIPNENERVILTEDATYNWTKGNILSGYNNDTNNTILFDGVEGKPNEKTKFVATDGAGVDDLTTHNCSEMFIDLGEVKNMSEIRLSSLLRGNTRTFYINAKYSEDGYKYYDFGQGYETGRFGANGELSKYAIMRNHTVRARYIKLIFIKGAVVSEVKIYGSENPIEEMDYNFERLNDIVGHNTVSENAEILLNGEKNQKLNDQGFTDTYVDLEKGKEHEIIVNLDQTQKVTGINLFFMRATGTRVPESIKTFVSYDGTSYKEINAEWKTHNVADKSSYRQFFEEAGVKSVKFLIKTTSAGASRLGEIGVYADQAHLPLFRGGFFQLHFTNGPSEIGVINNTDYYWYLQLKGMKEMGMDYVVMQYGVGDGTVMFDSPRMFELGYKRMVGYGSSDPYTVILEAAQKLGMKVFFGTTGAIGHYRNELPSDLKSVYNQATVTANAVIRDMYDNFNKYESFAGYYLSDEVADSWLSLYGIADAYRECYKRISDVIREVDPDRPIMVCPALLGKGAGTKAENMAYNLFKPATEGGRPIVDIVAIQDALGRENASSGMDDFSVSDSVYKGYELAIQAWAKGVRKAGAELWVDAEVFDGGAFTKKYNDCLDTLDIASRYTNGIINFDIPHYFSVMGENTHQRPDTFNCSAVLANYVKRYVTEYRELEKVGREPEEVTDYEMKLPVQGMDFFADEMPGYATDTANKVENFKITAPFDYNEFNFFKELESGAGKYTIMWDDENLYIAIKTNDNTDNAFAGANDWKTKNGDYAKIYIAPGKKTVTEADISTIDSGAYIILAKVGDTWTAKVQDGGMNISNIGSKNHKISVSKDSKGGTELLLALSWDKFFGMNAPKVNDAFKFKLLYSDNGVWGSSDGSFNTNISKAYAFDKVYEHYDILPGAVTPEGNNVFDVIPTDGIKYSKACEGYVTVKPKEDAKELDIQVSTNKEYKLYADAGFKKEIDGKISLNEQITKVYAVLEGIDAPIEIKIQKNSTKYSFADLKSGAWYIPYVDTATGLGIIRGSQVGNDTLLKPEDKATRIEGVIFALRMLGVDSTQFSDEKLNFADYNAEGEWSANYVKAAVALGLMKGSEVDGKLYLNGNNSISRQEFFAIFARAMQITDKDEAYKETDLSKFVDKDKIAPWFIDNIKYLVHNKIVDGNPDGKGGYIINPEGQILRCEIIKMVTAALTK